MLFESSCFFFFNDTATTEIYTLSLHDALPISERKSGLDRRAHNCDLQVLARHGEFHRTIDRKSTRLNSSHSQISYAVFCLKKKTTSSHQLRLVSERRPSTTTPAPSRSCSYSAS